MPSPPTWTTLSAVLLFGPHLAQAVPVSDQPTLTVQNVTQTAIATKCACDEATPFCNTDNWCYKSKYSDVYSNHRCRGHCTVSFEECPKSTCSQSFPHCSSDDGYCYKNPNSHDYDTQLCAGTCETSYVEDKCANANSWTDSMHFDCAIYEGAGWCTNDENKPFGPGWCETGEYDPSYPVADRCDHIYGPSYAWGGSTASFTDQTHPYSAWQVCPGCGGECAPTRKRTPLTIPTGCTDLPADANGKMWRDSWGYSCATYQYGNFCAKNAAGEWKEGGVWLEGGYGDLGGYKWKTLVGGHIREEDARVACCACGGGTTGAPPPPPGSTGAPPPPPPAAA